LYLEKQARAEKHAAFAPDDCGAREAILNSLLAI
jgi:hypothetical protein